MAYDPQVAKRTVAHYIQPHRMRRSRSRRWELSVSRTKLVSMIEEAPAAPQQPTAVVIGASFAGLLAASAAAQAGYQVTILERDQLPGTAAARPGVPQSEQAHVLLHRGMLAMESLLPGLRTELLDHGGKPFHSSQMPWLSEHGWIPLTDWSYEIISIGRPLLEFLVRSRVLAQAGVALRENTRVTGLSQTPQGWQIRDHDEVVATADLLIDASGRTSRLPHWLADIGIAVPEPTVIDARLGYATRRYRGTLPFTTGIAIAATLQTLTGALLLPIEQDRWLICAAGFGDHRPGREAAEFDAFLADLRDPAIADAAHQLEPDGDVAIHRQTGNRRYAYGSDHSWPTGLLVVGDALCALNPVYGHGITVGVSQAELLRTELRRRPSDPRRSRKIQRKLAAVADLPWSVCTSEDLRMPTSSGERSRSQEVLARWTTRMVQLAAAGNEECSWAFSQVYHLVGSPRRLFGPRVAVAILRSLTRPLPPAAGRPAVLNELARTGSAQA